MKSIAGQLAAEFQLKLTVNISVLEREGMNTGISGNIYIGHQWYAQ